MKTLFLAALLFLVMDAAYSRPMQRSLLNDLSNATDCGGSCPSNQTCILRLIQVCSNQNESNCFDKCVKDENYEPPECPIVAEQVCDNCAGCEDKEIRECAVVEEEKCEIVPRENCTTVQRKNCTTVQMKRCYDELTDNCLNLTEARRNGSENWREVCVDSDRDDCDDSDPPNCSTVWITVCTIQHVNDANQNTNKPDFGGGRRLSQIGNEPASENSGADCIREKKTICEMRDVPKCELVDHEECTTENEKTCKPVKTSKCQRVTKTYCDGQVCGLDGCHFVKRRKCDPVAPVTCGGVECQAGEKCSGSCDGPPFCTTRQVSECSDL